MHVSCIDTVYRCIFIASDLAVSECFLDEVGLDKDAIFQRQCPQRKPECVSTSMEKTTPSIADISHHLTLVSTSSYSTDSEHSQYHHLQWK